MHKSLLSSVFILLFIFSEKIVFAEGTPSVSPTSTANTALGLLPSVQSGSYLGCAADNRIYFNINNHNTENLYYGFDWRVYSPANPNPSVSNVYMRIFDPSGNQVGGNIQLPNTGAGYIQSRTEVMNGPNIGGLTPAGYTPLIFNPTQNGNYWIELYRSGDGGITQLSGTNWSFAPYFDLTIATTTGTKMNGRVLCRKWGFVAIDPVNFNNIPNGNSDANLIALTTDGVAVEIDYQDGFRPLAFNSVVNRFGAQSTGDFAVDRNSINSATVPSQEGGYPLFLNMPDANVFYYASTPGNPQSVSPAIIGCTAPYQIRYSLPDSGDVKILLDLNGTTGYQAGSSDRLIEYFNNASGVNTYTWDGLNGLGNAVPANTNFSIQITFLKGRYNLPVYDAEINKNGFQIRAKAPIVNNNLLSFWNDALLSDIGTTCTSTANNANNVTGTGLQNSISGSTGSIHAWSGNGNITQTIPAPAVGLNETDNFQCSDFGNSRIINTWGWGITTQQTMAINFKCVSVSGTVWNDVNGSAAGTISNIFTTGEVGTNAAQNLFVTLIDPVMGNVIQSVTVQNNGTYSLNSVPANGSSMEMRLTATQGIVGATPPAMVILQNGWGATSPLSRTISTLVSNISGVDFGVVNINPLKDSISTNQNIAVNGNVATNDQVIPGSSFVKIGSPLKGILNMNTNGTFTYTPNANVYGLDSVRYQVCSPSPISLCDTAILKINILVTNSVVAVNDADTTTINTPKFIAVKINDTDNDGNGTTITNPTIIVNPLHGTAVVQSNGTVLYTPVTGYVGSDQFQYRISDNGTPVATDTAIVNVWVYAPTHIANNDNVQLLQNTTQTGNVSTNDNVISNSTYSVLGAALHGSININANGTYTYTPQINYSGIDSVRYQVCSPAPMNICDTAVLKFSINGVQAVNDADTTTINTPKSIAVKLNDTNTDGIGTSITNPTIIVNPLHGTAVVQSNGTVLYTPVTGYVGSDQFQYRISDNGTPVATDTAIVNVWVYAPTHIANNDNVQLLQNTTQTGNVSTNDNVISNSTYSVLGAALHGSININANGTYTYTPQINYSGIDSVRYQVCSPAPMNICDTAVLKFSINGVQAVNDADTTTINTPKSIAVKLNDTNTDGIGTSITNPTIIVNPIHGTAVVQSNGTVLYTPVTGYVGSDQFQYRISDNGTPVATDTAIVNVWVYAPVFIALPDINQTTINTLITGNVAINDVRYINASYMVINNTSHGQLTLQNNGSYTYTPQANYIGKDIATIVMQSGAPYVIADTADLIFTIQSEFVDGNNNIVATPDAVRTMLNLPLQICVRCNDYDPQQDIISQPQIISLPQHGTATVQVDGNILYTPVSGYSGSDKLVYRICDNNINSMCDTATVFIEIANQNTTNNQNYANDDAYFTIVDVNAVGNVATNDFDPQNNARTFAKVSNPLHGTVALQSNGNFIYTPTSNYSGPDYFTYSSCDNAGNNGCDTATVYFSVLKLNTALPVEFVNFNVTAQLCEHHIVWQTTHEISLKEFAIEQSINSSNQTIIATINPLSTMGEWQTYVHNQTVTTDGLYAYRILAIDWDGKTTYTDWVTLKSTCTPKSELHLFPNPVQNQLHIEHLDFQSNCKITITDAGGNIVLNAEITDKSNHVIDLSHISNGVLFISLTQDDQTTHFKWMKCN